MSHVLAIDVGSSSVRAGMFTTHGDLVPNTMAQLTFELEMLPGGVAQIDAVRLREAAEQAIDLTLASPGAVGRTIAAVGVSTFWHSLLALDEVGHPLTPVYSWADTRSATDASDLALRIDPVVVHQRTGCRIHPSYLPAKLVWLQRYLPDIYSRSTHFVSFAQYLSACWLGTTDTSVSMASGSGLLNLRTCAWDAEWCDLLQIDPAQLGNILPDPEFLPPVRDDYARHWPALCGVPWRAAIGDGAAANVGINCTTADSLSLMVGTSGAMRRVAEDEDTTLPPALWRYRLDRKYTITGGALSEGGGVYAWLRATLNLPSLEDCEATLAAREPLQHGLDVLPLWSGERSPGWVGDAGAIIAGLHQHTSALDILQASLESVACRFALLYDALHTGHERVVATGGALRESSVWLQMMADALGTEIEHSPVAEASLRGAALIALRDAGLSDLVTRPSLVPPRICRPRAAAHARYVDARERQRILYEREVGDGGNKLLARHTR